MDNTDNTDDTIACTFVHDLTCDGDDVTTDRVVQARKGGLEIVFEEQDGDNYLITVRGKRSDMGEFARGFYNWSISDDGLESFAPAEPEHLNRAR